MSLTRFPLVRSLVRGHLVPGERGKVQMRLSAIELLAALLCVLSGSVLASETAVLGRAMKFTAVAQFCEVGGSPAEQQLFEMQRRNVEPAGQLVFLAVPCDELNRVRSGKSERFDSWLQVLALKARGELKLVKASRGAFVRGVAGSMTNQGINLAALNERYKALSQPGYTGTLTSVSTDGWNDDAAFISGRLNAQVGSESYIAVMFAALTVINEVPLGIYAYERTDARARVEPANIIMKQMLDGVLRDNAR